MTTKIKLNCGDCGAEFAIERIIDANSAPAPDEQPTYCPFCSSTMLGDFEPEQSAGRSFVLTPSRNPYWLDIVMLSQAWRLTQSIKTLETVVAAIKSLRATRGLSVERKLDRFRDLQNEIFAEIGFTLDELDAILEKAEGQERIKQ